MTIFYYGVHVAIDKGIEETFITAKHYDCNFVQIFFFDPASHKMRDISEKEIHYFQKQLKENKMKLVIHSPYILNFAKPFNPNNWGIKYLIKELNLSHSFSHGSVLHFGKYKDLSINEAIINMVTSIKYVLDNTHKDSNLLIETSAGQGSELCYNLNEFAIFWKQIPNKYKNRLGICIDTCHIFAAGYDITNKENVLKFLKEFDKKIGLKYVKLVHLNDSKEDCGKRLDRHEELGEGYIGKKGLKSFIKFCYINKIPIVLESRGEHHRELEFINTLVKKYEKK